jgi:UDP-glucose 4-epimerase
MLRDAEDAHGISHVALRYFNAAGADPDGELEEMHDPETHLIPLVLFARLDWLAAGQASSSFNLSNGRGFSITEVAQTAEQITRFTIKKELTPRRSGDPPVLIRDSSKAQKLLGWQPKFPELSHQIDHAWKWFRDGMPS